MARGRGHDAGPGLQRHAHRNSADHRLSDRDPPARAEALGEDLDEIAGTSLDKGVELDALKELPQEERKELIQRAKAGEQVSARSEEDRERNVRLVRQTIADLARLAKFSNPAEVATIAYEIGIGAAESAIAKAIAGNG